MSQVVPTQTPSLENNASKAAVSTPKDIDIVAIVAKNAARQSKNGTVLQSTTCNRSKLFSATCAEVKSLLGMEATARLSTELANKVDEAVDIFLVSIIRQITPQNIISHTVTYKHKPSDMAVVEQVTLKGYNVIELEKQFYGIGELIKQAEKRLETIRKNFSSTDNQTTRELIENAQKSVTRLKMTKEHITTQLEELKKQKSAGQSNKQS